MLAAPLAVAATPEAVAEAKLSPGEKQRLDDCNRMHSGLRHAHPGDPKALHDAWLTKRDQCAGTGIYEYLLAYAEHNIGNDTAAIAIYTEAVKKKLPYWQDSWVMLNTLRGEQILKTRPGDLVKLREIRDELAAFAAARPPDAFAYQQLAAMNVTLKEFPAAIDAARKSIEAGRLAGKAARYLVMALHETDRCAEAVKEIRPAVDHSSELLADPDFMIPASDCYALAGDPQTGEAALKALLKHNPSAQDDKRVHQLQEYFAVKNHPQPAPK